MSFDTDGFSLKMRERGIAPEEGKVLISDLRNSEQAVDMTDPPNCGGYGRIRHFNRKTAAGWPDNPLPIDPANRALGLPSAEMIRAQVFQNAVCNWRCWYCFVDFPLLSGDSERSAMFSAAELLDRLLDESDPPAMLDLSGGQPDLVPEWVVWFAEEIDRRGIGDRLFLWSDDNLSNDYFWTRLDSRQRAVLDRHPGYGKVCCFKGFDERSFAFNTGAPANLFDRQFELFGRLLAETEIDLYAYATLTSPDAENLPAHLSTFLDRLQTLDRNLPLRLVPLRVEAFTPAKGRMGPEHHLSLDVQEEAIAAWNAELKERFTEAERRLPITEVQLRDG